MVEGERPFMPDASTAPGITTNGRLTRSKKLLTLP
jgi:hypothetical protein